MPTDLYFPLGPKYAMDVPYEVSNVWATSFDLQETSIRRLQTQIFVHWTLA